MKKAKPRAKSAKPERTDWKKSADHHAKMAGAFRDQLSDLRYHAAQLVELIRMDLFRLADGKVVLMGNTQNPERCYSALIELRTAINRVQTDPGTGRVVWTSGELGR